MENATSTRSPRGIFGSSIPSAAAFLVATLLFLLPFAEVRCNGNAIAHNTGLGIAMGTEWKEDITKSIFGDSFENNERRRESDRQRDPNAFAIAALALGIIGLAIAVAGFPRGSIANFYIALLAAASLIGMLTNLRSHARSETSIRSSDLNIDAGMKITVDGTIWLYLTMVFFVVAAFFTLRQNRVETS